MRNIEEMLSYPRSIMRGNLEMEYCAHQGEYAKGDDYCLVCIDAGDCQWVQRNHELAKFDRRDHRQLTAELEYARDYISAQVTFWGHRQNSCGCASCSWLREAQGYSMTGFGVAEEAVA